MKKLKLFTLIIGINTIVYGQWEKTNYNYTDEIISISVDRDNIFVGSRDGILFSDDKGATWVPKNNGLSEDNYIGPFAFTDSIIFAACNNCNNGEIYKSINYGESWVKSGIQIQETMVRTLDIVNGELIAGTYGGVYKSEDLGDTWNKYNSGLLDSIVFALKMSDTNIYIGVNNGIYLSTDNCEKWNNVYKSLSGGYVNSIAVLGDTIYATTEGTLLKSHDLGKSWIDITGNLPYNMNEVAIYENNVFVITSIGIYLLNKTIYSWELINSGLVDSNTVAIDFISDNIYIGVHNSGIWKRKLSDFSADIDKPEVSTNVSYFPNPVKNTLHLKLEQSLINENITFLIYNNLGQLIKRELLYGGNIEFDMSYLEKGFYFIEIKIDNLIEVIKVMKE